MILCGLSCGGRCGRRKDWHDLLQLQNRIQWALNSAVECHPHTVEVVGSNPTAPTIFPIIYRPHVQFHMPLSASPATLQVATVIVVNRMVTKVTEPPTRWVLHFRAWPDQRGGYTSLRTNPARTPISPSWMPSSVQGVINPLRWTLLLSKIGVSAG